MDKLNAYTIREDQFRKEEVAPPSSRLSEMHVVLAEGRVHIRQHHPANNSLWHHGRRAVDVARGASLTGSAVDALLDDIRSPGESSIFVIVPRSTRVNLSEKQWNRLQDLGCRLVTVEDEFHTTLTTEDARVAEIDRRLREECEDWEKLNRELESRAADVALKLPEGVTREQSDAIREELERQ